MLITSKLEAKYSGFWLKEYGGSDTMKKDNQIRLLYLIVFILLAIILKLL